MTKILYKYLPPERKTYLSDGLLRFTPPSALNDPYEVLPGISDEALESSFASVKSKYSEMPEHLRNLENDPSPFIEHFLKQGMGKINNSLGILSLSESWNNPLMWSHYTDSHQGLCIGFNSKHSFFAVNKIGETKQGMIALPVKYSDRRFVLTAKKMNMKDVHDVLYVKSIDWKYEKEVRVIATLDKAVKIVDATPFNISLFNVPHDAICEIVIGLRATQEIQESAMRLANELSISLYKTVISRQTFNLERILI
ncbi:MAG TPA: DUF2971 domain-containing protein [Cellvibrio sp.]